METKVANHTEELASPSFKDQVKKLEDTLKKFRDIIPQNGGEQKGEKLHCFGPHNLYLEQEGVNEMVDNMTKQYQKFTSTSNITSVTKLTNEKLFLSNLVNPLKATLKCAISKMRDVATDTTLKSTVLKLEAISLEEGLRFDCEQMNSNCFISSDMFYIEILLDSIGQPNDVKLQGHTGEPISCKELVSILKTKDYREFRSHLQGLKSRYLFKGNAAFYQSKMPTKILSALEALEEDVVKIMRSSDISCNILSDCIMSGPVGYVIPRDGGKNLQITYLANPMSLLDLENQGIIKVYSLEEILPRDVGTSAVLSVRQAPPTLLPLSSLVSCENNVVRYSKQDASNSEEVPAVFVLNLSKPLPVSIQTMKSINKLLTKGNNFQHSSTAKLDNLILREHIQMSEREWEKNMFIIELSDQIHNFTCFSSEEKENIGLLLSCISFNHPAHLPPLIKILRSQAMYNMLLCSCVNNTCKVGESSGDKKQLFFDACASNWNTITVTFIHPIDRTISSVDFVVSTDCFIECSLNIVPGSPMICHNINDYLSKIANRSLSIPIVMRSMFKKAESYKPEMGKSTLQKAKDKKALLRPMKLQMPTLAQIQSEMPLMSPHILASPSTFLNFSPGAPLFMSDPVQKGTISKKRTPAGNVTPLGTPNSDGSRTPSKQKIKITLKRKRTETSDVYEIDQTKSEFEMDTNTPVEKPSEFSFNYSQPDDPKKSSFLDTFPNVGSMDGETDLDGLLGIPSEPFPHNPLSANTLGSTSVPAFDLDALASNRAVNFDSIIDPSSLIKTPNSFDMDGSGMIDIDNLMNSVPSV